MFKNNVVYLRDFKGEDNSNSNLVISDEALNSINLLINAIADFDFSFKSLSDDDKDNFFYVCLYETITKFNLNVKQTFRLIDYSFDRANYIPDYTLMKEAFNLLKAVQFFDESREDKNNVRFEVVCAKAMKQARFNNPDLFLNFLVNRIIREAEKELSSGKEI